MFFERADGPECPTCGCRDTELYLSEYRPIWGDPDSVLCLCRNCHEIFAPREETIRCIQLEYTGPNQKCPYCNSRATEVNTSRRPRRYHNCRDCLGTFTTLEGETNGKR